MNLQAFVPLVTYPEANVDVLGAHVAFVAAEIGAAIHAAAINADIPDTSNALSRLLINTPKLIREAQTASRHRGEHLLTVLKEKAETAGVQLTTAALSAPLAMSGEAAALHARYYDLSLVGGKPAIRRRERPPRQSFSVRGDQPCCCPNYGISHPSTTSRLPRMGAELPRARLPTPVSP